MRRGRGGFPQVLPCIADLDNTNYEGSVNELLFFRLKKNEVVERGRQGKDLLTLNMRKNTSVHIKITCSQSV